MEKLLLLLMPVLFFILVTDDVQAQSVTSEAQEHHLFLELSGSGGLYSVNYERAVKPLTYLRVGASYLYAGNFEVQFPDGEFRRSTHALTLPVFLSRLIGKKNHYLELGAGVIPNVFLDDRDVSSDTRNEFYLYGGLVAGYRYQPAQRGITLRAGFTPWFTFDALSSSFGLSIGYRF